MKQFFAFLLAILSILPPGIAGAAPRPAETALVDGFLRTVFGAEISSGAFQGHVVKKYVGPVRVHIDQRARRDRRAAVARFVGDLRRQVRGLDIALAGSRSEANFIVHVVDRVQYNPLVAAEVTGTRGAAPGRCLVKVVGGAAGIARSAAVIVSDEGEPLFRRCLVEEILQGLGPVNDSSYLPQSVFNDTSPHTVFTLFDRRLMNMLYDPRVRAGMTQRQVLSVLPTVAAEARRRVR